MFHADYRRPEEVTVMGSEGRSLTASARSIVVSVEEPRITRPNATYFLSKNGVEFRIVCVRTLICHSENSSYVVLYCKILVGKKLFFSSFYVSSLNPAVWHNSVNY